MRCAYVVLPIALIPFFAPQPLGGEQEKEAPIAAVDVRPVQMLAELNRVAYVAKRPIPASDNLFIEEGKVIESLYALARKEYETAIPLGRATAVSQVVLLDKAVHIFLEDDKCALLILTKEDQKVGDMTLDQLLELARKGLATLFQIRNVEAKPKLPT